MIKKNLTSALLSAIALLSVPQASSAQLKPEVPIGSRIAVKPRDVKGEAAGLIIRGFGKCMIGNHKKNAKLLLENSDPLSVDVPSVIGPKGNIIKAFGMETCLGRQADVDQSALGLKFTPTRLREILLEEAYLLANKNQPNADVNQIIARKFITKEPNLKQAQAFAEFSDCISEKNPRLADQLLRTISGSSEALDATKALAPTFGECLFEGQTIKLNAASARSFVADGMYHRFGSAAFSDLEK